MDMRLGRGMAAAAVLTTLGTFAATPHAAVAQDYHGRKAWNLQNQRMKVVVTPGGGHIASITLRSGRGANINPLWLPKWQSVEPGNWRGGRYGDPPGAQLLSSILGHNLCLDFFGAPSAPEVRAGIPVHGEAPVLNWRPVQVGNDRITYTTTLPEAQMKVTRTIRLTPSSSTMWISETVENLSGLDKPFGWQQHVTLGAPFLREGESFFDMPAGWAKVFPQEFSTGERLKRGEEFQWPDGPGKSSGTIDLREFPKGRSNSDFTATAVNPAEQKDAWFTAVNVKHGVMIGYVWPAKDWPWIANWEENRFRSGVPWRGREVARGIEFGTSPFPISKREAVKMGTLNEIPTYRWIDGRGKQTIGYAAFIIPVPAGTTGASSVKLNGRSITVELTGVNRTITLPLAR